jgi:hypothetical protein
VEHLVGETEVFGEKLPQFNFFNYKSHMTWPGIETGLRCRKPANNRMSYGKARNLEKF